MIHPFHRLKKERKKGLETSLVLHRKSVVDESWKLRNLFLHPVLNQLETGRLQTIFSF